MISGFSCEQNTNEVKFEELVVTVTGSSWKPRYGEMRSDWGKWKDGFRNHGGREKLPTGSKIAS